MIQNKITTYPLSEIQIIRENRQRTELTPDSVLDLAVSIGTNQWISPLLVDSQTKNIIAGERRFTAVTVLQKALTGDYSAFANQAKAKEALLFAVKCRVASWENWTKIPVQFGTDFTEMDRLIHEFAENNFRQDLPWQDKAKACYTIHSKFLLENQADKKWTLADTARMLGLSIATVSSYLQAWREHEAGGEKVEAVVKGSTSLRAATKAIERMKSRKEPALSLEYPKEDYDTGLSEETLPPASPILCEDFTLWAPSYAGPKFNFIHCDFPYGIKYNAGAGQGTGADTAALGNYDDSEEVYWKLISSLTSWRDNLCSDSCHVMFWYSSHFFCETQEIFHAAWPDATIQPFPMIWHCSDNSGLLPDPQRYGRRTYETAMLISLGDRKIAKAKALSFSSPRNEAKIHRSQKHLPVLSHFFEMFVDDTTVMLDPTCGSGTSLVAAKRLGATYVLGLEKDAEMVEAATKFYREQIKCS